LRLLSFARLCGYPFPVTYSAEFDRATSDAGALQSSWTRFLAPVVVIGIAFLMIVFAGGIDVGYSNHVGILPVVRRILDPSYLPGDFNIAMRLYHHREFADLIAVLSSAVGEDRAVIAVSLVSMLTLAASLYCLCRTIGLTVTGSVLAGVLVASNVGWAGRGLEENNFAGSADVNPPQLAHAMVLFAIAAWLAGHHRLTAFLAGMALFFHLQVGAIAAIALAPLYIARIRVIGLREILWCAVFYLLAAWLPLWHFYQMTRRGVMGSALTVSYLDFRMPHHFEFASTAAVLWIGGHVLLQVAVYFYLRSRNSRLTKGVGVIAVVSIMLALLSAAQFVDYHWLKHVTLAKFQFYRLSPLISVLGAVAAIALTTSLANRISGSARILVYAVLFVAAGLQATYRIAREPQTWRLGVRRYAHEPSDWVDICRWVDEHGPQGVTYLTPPAKSGFTYLSNRSNVVEYKINPDGAQFLNEWYARLTDLAGGVLPQARGYAVRPILDAAFAALSRDQLMQIGRKYGAKVAVLPRASRVAGPDLEILYDNGGYRVVSLPD
jgi:hypothetical protein